MGDQALLHKMDADKAAEMETLTALAHQRRAEAKAKQEAAAAARALREQAQARLLDRPILSSVKPCHFHLLMCDVIPFSS